MVLIAMFASHLFVILQEPATPASTDAVDAAMADAHIEVHPHPHERLLRYVYFFCIHSLSRHSGN